MGTFSDIFLNKEQKETRFKEKAGIYILEMENYIRDLEKTKKEFIAICITAKTKGLERQYADAFKGLKIAYAQQVSIDAMKLNFKILLQMRDMTRMTGEFAAAMGMVSQDINKLVGNMDLIRMESDFDVAMLKYENMSEWLTNMLDKFSENIRGIEVDESTIGDEEITKMIISAVAAEESGRVKDANRSPNKSNNDDELNKIIEERIKRIRDGR